ncbi:MAG: hypothetical protein JNJ50_12095 [Acidobacteria bacterium]|nr:hypothetical protein [Acidobacteriota bacterium]
MRNVFSICLRTLFLAALCVASVCAQSREEKKTVAFNPGGDLRVTIDRGSVQLIGWERNEVEVYARIERPKNDDRDFDVRSIELTRIEILGDTRSLTIRANYDELPKRSKWSDDGRSTPDVHFEIRAPRSVNLNLDGDRAQVTLRAVTGYLQVTTDRSQISGEDLKGDLRLKLDRGALTLRQVQARMELVGDRTNVKVSGLVLTGDSRLEVDRGEVEVGLARAQGLTISANRSRRAGFESDFAIATRVLDDERIEGEINGGGPRLTIRNDRGKTRLRQE